MTDLRYPIGKFTVDDEITIEQIEEWIQVIADAPECLRKAVAGMSATELDTPYRPEGWTVRQVVHHIADSHMNSFMRFKLALTETEPTIKTYDEKLWAELADSTTAPIEMSLSLITALHDRWVYLLRSMDPVDFRKTYIHPDRGPLTLAVTVGLYAWHSKHHVAHITSLRQQA